MTISFRTLGIGLVAAAVCLATFGTGGFGSASVDRGVTVEVAGDESAYVGYDSPDEISIDANGTVTLRLVTISNRYHAEFDITDVDVDAPDSLSVTVMTELPGTVPAGEAVDIEAELECDGSVDDEELSVTVRVDSDDITAELLGDAETRTISVTCEG